MKRALLLNIIVRERTSVFKLLARKNQTLLVRGNSLFILYLRFHVVDCVRRLNLQRDGLAGESLHENLDRKSVV